MLLSINQESNTFLVGIGSTGKSKTKAVTIGLARALAYDLELPQASVEDPHMYYRSEHLQTVSALVGRIMEVCLLDTDAIMKEVMSFYLFRYQSCYDNSMFHSQSGTSNGIVDIFKLYKHFSEETLCFMKDNATEISVMNNGFKKVLEQLSKKVA